MVRNGERIVYIGSAMVCHHIEPHEITPRHLRRRAARFGRTPPHLFGPCQPELLQTHRIAWRLRRYLATTWAAIRFAGGQLRADRERRLAATLSPLADMYYQLESLHLARKETQQRQGVAT
jgi:hypothetical protein